MKALLMTFCTVAICLGWLIVFDVIALHREGPEATISHQLLQAAREHPVVPLVIGWAIGLLCGHLFWPQH